MAQKVQTFFVDDLDGSEAEAWVPQMILTLGARNPGLSWENKGAHGEAACI